MVWCGNASSRAQRCFYGANPGLARGGYAAYAGLVADLNTSPADDLPADEGGSGDRSDILKAVLGASSNAFSVGDASASCFTEAGAIDPPYNPSTLLRLFEVSVGLRPCVDAYVTNIDGFGHTFEPVIDFDDDDADQKLAQAMAEERAAAKMAGDPVAASLPAYPTPQEVLARKEEMTWLMRVERARLDRFFEECADDDTFIGLRRKLRQDLELIGNAFVEVLRNGAGEIVGLTYLPSFCMRLLPMDSMPVDATVRQRVSDVSYAEVTRPRRFRRYVQAIDNVTVFFREFGDPRPVSCKTGRYLTSVQDLASDPSDRLATEVLHLKIHSPRGPYGVPRWIGSLVSVLGSRQAEEVNAAYFENKSVPPMAALISGGHLTTQSVARLQTHIEKNIKGKANFHKVLILEAVPASGGTLDGSGTGTCRVELKSLADAQLKDALFQGYDEHNLDKIGMVFRLPRLLRGDIRDFNRASAEAAVKFVEQQVFQPERVDFDAAINRRILGDMGVRFWRFRSLGPDLTDPEVLGELVHKLTLGNILTPAEARELVEPVVGRQLKKIRAAWTEQPLPLSLAGIPVAEALDGEAWTGDEEPVGEERAPYQDLNGEVAPGETSLGDLSALSNAVLSSVLTVNEARAQVGLGPLLRPDGMPDPMGTLTVAEFTAATKAKPRPPRPVPGAGGSLGLAGLTRDKGASLAQGAPFTAKRPSSSSHGSEAYLLALRDKLLATARQRATERFAADRQAATARLEGTGSDLPDEGEYAAE